MNTTSDSAEDASATLIDDQAFTILSNYCYTVAAALSIWYYLLTLDKEVSFFWKRRPSGASLIFLINRYLTLFVVLYNSTWWPASMRSYVGCSTMVFEQCFLPYAQYVVWAVFSSLRVYALQRRWWWPGAVFVLSLSIVISNVLQAPLVHTWTDPETHSCEASYDISELLDQRLCILSRGSLVVAETIVVVLTWVFMRDQCGRRAALQACGRRVTLSSVFYNNGRIYFVLTTIMYMLHLLVEVLPNTKTKVEVMNYVYMVITPTEPLIGLLVDHFLIELQEAVCANAAVPGGSDTALGAGVGSSFGGVPEELSRLMRFVRADVDSWMYSDGVGVTRSLDRLPGDEEDLEKEKETCCEGAESGVVERGAR